MQCLSEACYMKIRKKISYIVVIIMLIISELVSIVEEASGDEVGIGKVSGAVR